MRQLAVLDLHCSLLPTPVTLGYLFQVRSSNAARILNPAQSPGGFSNLSRAGASHGEQGLG